jgi:hypothetical protein
MSSPFVHITLIEDTLMARIVIGIVQAIVTALLAVNVGLHLYTKKKERDLRFEYVNFRIKFYQVVINNLIAAIDYYKFLDSKLGQTFITAAALEEAFKEINPPRENHNSLDNKSYYDILEERIRFLHLDPVFFERCSDYDDDFATIMRVLEIEAKHESGENYIPYLDSLVTSCLKFLLFPPYDSKLETITGIDLKKVIDKLNEKDLGFSLPYHLKEETDRWTKTSWVQKDQLKFSEEKLF